MTTLILSDLHLGSRSSQVGPLEQILATNFDQLILNGDTINNLNLKKLKRKHWRIMDRLRDVARRRELVLIRGNHDIPTGDHDECFGPMQVLSSLLGVPIHEEYPLDVGGRKYIVLHGDRFDPTLRWPIVTDTADWCYRRVQGVNRSAASWIKSRVKHLGGAIEFVKRRSVEYARNSNCDGVITGHTHFCDDDWVSGTHYLNTGCWVDWPCTYVLVRDGQIELCRWNGSLAKSKLSRSAASIAESYEMETSGYRRTREMVPSAN